VVRCLQHGGSAHFVIGHPDGTRGLLPAWMTEPRAGQLATTEAPRLAPEALRALRSVVIGALLSAARCRQLDLLMQADKVLKVDRVSPATRAEVTRLLKRLMTEYVGAGAAPSVEAAADE
jgi:hypothetical protein